MEPQPKLYAELVSKNRRAFSFNGCISPIATKFKVLFHCCDSVLNPLCCLLSVSNSSIGFTPDSNNFYIWGIHTQALMKVSMDAEDWKKGGGTLGYMKVHGVVSTIVVDCYPFANILAAANVSHLDLLSLDVQGAELDIIKTIPWDVIDIQVSKPIFEISRSNFYLKICYYSDMCRRWCCWKTKQTKGETLPWTFCARKTVS